MLKVALLVVIAVAFTGAKPNNPRIIGGTPAEQGEHPYLVSLEHPLTKFHFCGGSIIDERHILTAGHCLHGQLAIQVTAYVGSVYLNKGGTYHPAQHLAVHPDFNSNTATNDVGVVTLKNPLTIGGDVQPILLPIGITVNPGDEATATGWGTIRYPNEETPNQLQEYTSTIVSNEECAKELDSEIIDGQICFGGLKGHGLCYGDSGSPLVYKVDDQRYAIGVVSWGDPCANGKADVYGRVSTYLDWIKEQLNN